MATSKNQPRIATEEDNQSSVASEGYGEEPMMDDVQFEEFVAADQEQRRQRQMRLTREGGWCQ